MSQSDDLDMALDGYEPDSGYYRRPEIVTAQEDDEVTATIASARALRKKPRPKADDSEESPVADKVEKAAGEKADNSGGEAQEKRLPAFVRFFLDDRVRLFAGCLLIFLSVFILVAFVSHFKYAKVDQSLLDNMTMHEIASDPSIIMNAAGPFGAWMAKTFFCDALGLGSLAFIVYSWILALAILGFKKCNFWSVTFKTLIVAISASVVLGLLTYYSPSVIKWGGTHGYFINEFLIANSTMLGAILVSLLLLVAVACVYLEELAKAWKKWRLAMERHRLQMELERERKEKARHLADVEENSPSEGLVSKDDNEEETVQKEPQRAVAIDVDDVPAASREGVLPIEGLFGPTSPAIPGLEDVPEDFDLEIDTEADSKPSSEGVDSAFALDIDSPRSEELADAQAQEKAMEGEGDDSFAAGDDGASAFAKGEEAAADLTEEVEKDFSVKAHEIEMADPEVIDSAPAASALYDHKAELPRYMLPTTDLLEDRVTGTVIDMEEQQENKERIVKTLASYNIAISRIEATVGPTVTLYEIVPAEGVRISQIKRLEDDIALSLAALGIRIIAPIPGKPTVGIEVPNGDPQTVSMRSVIASKKFQECKMKLPMALGATISNEIFIADLAKMPHLLVAGATGMGKSVGLNVIITSLLYKRHPSELKFVMVDPKMVEFSLYSKLERHYLAKLPGEDEAIITDSKKAVQTLNSLCIEMDQRYALLKDAGVRALEEYNKKFTERRLNPADGHRFLPYLVVVVDEFADLIMVAGKEVEAPIMRIAQKARAVGMHMIIATQRPSTNVITGPIKANFPGRMAFRTIQMVDSKTILDATGANQLIGRGDMLFSHNGSMERVQCAFIDTPEVERITEWIDGQVGYEHAYYLPEYVPEGEEGAFAGPGADRDSLFDDAARFVVSRQVGSTSMLQRQFNIGYNRAGRLMDQMEAAGIVGPVNGSKPRAILADSMQLEQMLSQF
ncbi:MAG: DNA translocase FtsK [Clostridium sp.]|nr:DNA translocase FtsK [Clostridium sp.]